jgi:hypothetical protein
MHTVKYNCSGAISTSCRGERREKGGCLETYSARIKGTFFGVMAVVVLICGAAPVQCAEISLKPSISVAEEFNDNVLVTRTNKKTDFITRVTPKIELGYSAPFWNWSFGYYFDYLHFAKNSIDDQFNNYLTVNETTRIIDNLLYLDLSDVYTRSSLNVNQDTSLSNPFTNQTDQNTLMVTPYLKFMPMQRLSVKTGYTYSNVIFTEPNTINWQGHNIFLMTEYELTPKLSWTSSVTYAYTLEENSQHYGRLTPTVGIKYNYSSGSRGFADAGYNVMFMSSGQTLTSPYWNLGILHDFGLITTEVSGGVNYNVDPTQHFNEQRKIIGRIEKLMHRGKVGLFAGYYTSRDIENDNASSWRFSTGINSSFYLGEKLLTHLDLTLEKGNNFTYQLPYALMASAGVSYELIHDLNLSLDYKYQTYCNSIGNANGSVDNNRVILALTKKFKGFSF